jgi:hypothetical protein
MLQLLCAYAPSRNAVRAQLTHLYGRVSPECAQWREATRRWSGPLHHYKLLSVERVRALLVAGADAHARDGATDAPTPHTMAEHRLLHGGGFDDGRGRAVVGRQARALPRGRQGRARSRCCTLARCSRGASRASSPTRPR